MTFQENARFADVLNHRQVILRVTQLAIENRFSHGQSPGAWNPQRGFVPPQLEMEKAFVR